MACFNRQASDPTACNMDTIFARGQDEMSNLMKTKQVDFTYPFQANHNIDDDGCLMSHWSEHVCHLAVL